MLVVYDLTYSVFHYRQQVMGVGQHGRCCTLPILQYDMELLPGRARAESFVARLHGRFPALWHRRAAGMVDWCAIAYCGCSLVNVLSCFCCVYVLCVVLAFSMIRLFYIARGPEGGGARHGLAARDGRHLFHNGHTRQRLFQCAL